jgi:hypothetical protein
MACEPEQLISCDGSLTVISNAGKLMQLWLLVKNNYPSLSDKAINVFLPFVTTYLCKTGLSAAAAVMRTKQAHPSH